METAQRKVQNVRKILCRRRNNRATGIESKIEPRPQFLAPNYKGSDKLKDKVAIVTGGDSGIGRSVAFVFFAPNADSSYITGEVLTLLGGKTMAG